MKKILSIAVVSALAAQVSLNAQEDNAMTIITATKTEQKQSEITANTTIITSETIKNKHYTDIAELLSDVSGVSFSRNGGIGRNVDLFLRGMGSNRTLVLIDGIRFQDPSSTAGADFGNLMISDIEKVEIIKGAQSGIWGADAAAGVINIITKKAKNGFSSDIALEHGSYETLKYGANIGYKNEKFDIKIGANKIESDGFSAQAQKGEDVSKYENDGYENTTINLKGGINLGDGRLEGVYATIDALGDYDSSSPDDDTMKSDVKDNLYKIAYSQKLGTNTIKLQNTVSTFKRDEIGTSWGVKLFEGKTNLTELSDEIIYMDNSKLIIGASSENYKAEYEDVSSVKNSMTETNSAIFITNTNSFGDFAISESLRQDDYDNFDKVITGKIGAKYNNNGWLFGANYGSAYNAPNLIQILNPWASPNTDLEPETVKSYDIQMGYEFITVTYFWQKVENLVFWNDKGTYDDWNDDFYDNSNGTSTIKGYEIELKKPIVFLSSHLSANYMILDARNADGKFLLYRPKEQLDASFDFYGIDSFHTGLKAHYVGERYESDDEQGAQTGKYTIYSAVANYDINKNARIYAKIENLTDVEYQIASGYAASERAFYSGINASF